MSKQNNNCSVFRASPNRDEDWRKIADPTQRRKLQNRIAQRNYRTRCKMHLEDLQRRVAASQAKSSNNDVELGYLGPFEGGSCCDAPASIKATSSSGGSSRCASSPRSGSSQSVSQQYDSQQQYNNDNDSIFENPSAPQSPLYLPYPTRMVAQSALAVPAKGLPATNDEVLPTSNNSLPLYAPLNTMPYKTAMQQDGLFAGEEMMYPFNVGYVMTSGV